jgi:hypothetical protein
MKISAPAGSRTAWESVAPARNRGERNRDLKASICNPVPTMIIIEVSVAGIRILLIIKSDSSEIMGTEHIKLEIV